MTKINERELFKPFNNCFERFKPNLEKKLQIGRYVVWGLSIAFFLTEYKLENLQGMFFSILVLFFTNLCFSLSNFSGRMAYSMFLASFFCFMLGRMSMEFITVGKIQFDFTDDISKHMMLVIFLSLCFLQLGMIISKIIFKKNFFIDTKRKKKVFLEKKNIERLRLNTKILFYISAICVITMYVEEIFFVWRFSYVDLYVNFSSNIPRIIQIVGNMHIALFFLFFATCPNKRECLFPMILFLLISITVLVAGDRGTFVMNVAAILVYIFWRQYHDNEIWINNKIIFVGIISLPFVFVGLSFWVYIREGIDIGKHSFFAQFVRFFRKTGTSVDILGYGKEFQTQFPQSFYSFGKVIDYIKYNPIAEKLLGVISPKQYTVEYATMMHSYAHTISYFIFPEQYLLGHGKGSAYLAEIYQDFGYGGIIIWNALYGLFLSWFENGKGNIKNMSPYTIAIAFMMLRAMFYIPRGSAIYPVSEILNITTVFIYLFIYITIRYQKSVSSIFSMVN